MKKWAVIILVGVLLLSIIGCDTTTRVEDTSPTTKSPKQMVTVIQEEDTMSDNFILLEGGTFEMGSLHTEGWRGEDETRHSVTVSGFYLSRYEVTQWEYQEITGDNPSTFSGDDLPWEYACRAGTDKLPSPLAALRPTGGVSTICTAM